MNYLRKDYIDIIKGISVISIVLLHYEDGIFPKQINTWIGFFMITAFYFTSGWLFGLSNKKITTNELLRKRIKSLAIPYLYFSLIILIFDLLFVLVGFYDIKIVLRDLYKTLTLRGIGTLWFLPALFFGEFIFIYLRNKNSYFTIITILVTLIYMVGYDKWSVRYVTISEIYRIINAPLYVIRCIANAWIIIGIAYLISRKYGEKIQKLSIFQLTLLTVASLIGYTFVQKTITLSFQFPLEYLLTIFTSVCGPFAILLFSFLIRKLFVSKYFIYWGKNSMVLMAVHYSILMEICIIINKHCFGQPQFIGINTIYFFIATMIVMYPINYFINSKASFLIGK